MVKEPKSAGRNGGQDEKLISATMRTISVLEALAQRGCTSLEPLATKVGMSKATLFRFLRTLKNLGYVIQHDDTKYSLGLKMFNVGAQALTSMDIYEAARPVLRRLSEHFGETVHLAVMVDEKVLYVMKMESRHTIRMYSTIGKQAPLYCTSLGKALLAWSQDREAIVRRIEFVPYTKHTIDSAEALERELALTKERGYSVDAQEHEENIHCLGAPVFDYTGEVVAAISVAWPIFRFDIAKEKDCAKVIIEAAAELSALLGYGAKTGSQGAARKENLTGYDYQVKNAEDLPTPALVFFEDAIAANIAEACRIAGDPARLRPHVKTHKTAEIAAMEMKAGISRFKCATVPEAEMLARAGAKDVLLSYPLYGANARRFAALAAAFPDVRFSTIVDAPEGLAGLLEAATSSNSSFGAFLDVDVGQHRTGIAPGEVALDLYAKIASSGRIYPAGLHCYDGHNHQKPAEEREAAAAACYGIMESVRDPLLTKGLPVPEVVMGGTPTFPCYARKPGVTLSPGTCFLQDYSYSSSYADMSFACAALVVARVVSVNRDRGEFCIDLGYKGISADPQGQRGVILGMEYCEPLLQNEEHWVFSSAGHPLPELGAIVYVVPTHICPTVALYERAYVVDVDRMWRRQWKIAARDRVVGI